jgi:hypothetical protein
MLAINEDDLETYKVPDLLGYSDMLLFGAQSTLASCVVSTAIDVSFASKKGRMILSCFHHCHSRDSCFTEDIHLILSLSNAKLSFLVSSATKHSTIVG